MKKWIIDRPYLSTTIIFLIILFFGWRFLYWQEENYGFLLLLYFIVTLGIRLDDISRKIGTRSGAAAGNPDDKETISQQLTDIKNTLLSINATLNKILEKTKEKEGSGLDS